MSDISPDLAEEQRRATIRSIIGRNEQLEVATEEAKKSSRDFGAALKETSTGPLVLDAPGIDAQTKEAGEYHDALERLFTESANRQEATMGTFFDQFSRHGVGATNASLEAYEAQLATRRGGGGGGGGGGYGSSGAVDTGSWWYDNSPLLHTRNPAGSVRMVSERIPEWSYESSYLFDQWAEEPMGEYTWTMLRDAARDNFEALTEISDLAVIYYEEGFSQSVTFNALKETMLLSGMDWMDVQILLAKLLQPLEPLWREDGQGLYSPEGVGGSPRDLYDWTVQADDARRAEERAEQARREAEAQALDDERVAKAESGRRLKSAQLRRETEGQDWSLDSLFGLTRRGRPGQYQQDRKKLALDLPWGLTNEEVQNLRKPPKKPSKPRHKPGHSAGGPASKRPTRGGKPR